MHHLLQPFLDELSRIDSVLQSLPDGLPVPNVYQDPMNDWSIEWYHDPDNTVNVSPWKHEILWYVQSKTGDKSGSYHYGEPFPAVLTTAVQTLQEKLNASQG